MKTRGGCRGGGPATRFSQLYDTWHTCIIETLKTQQSSMTIILDVSNVLDVPNSQLDAEFDGRLAARTDAPTAYM